MHFRWIIRDDLPEVTMIDYLSFEDFMDEEKFRAILKQTNKIGKIAEVDNHIIGYYIYSPRTSRIDLLRLAVHPDYRRQGYGRMMLASLEEKLYNKRRELKLSVDDRNLEAHLWLKACGYRATQVKQDEYVFIKETMGTINQFSDEDSAFEQANERLLMQSLYKGAFQESFAQHVHNVLHDWDFNHKIDSLYDEINHMMEDFQIEELNLVFKYAFNIIDDLKLDTVLGLLTASLPVKTQLTYRDAFYLEAERRTKEKGWEQDTLKGLA